MHTHFTFTGMFYCGQQSLSFYCLFAMHSLSSISTILNIIFVCSLDNIYILTQNLIIFYVAVSKLNLFFDALTGNCRLG